MASRPESNSRRPSVVATSAINVIGITSDPQEPLMNPEDDTTVDADLVAEDLIEEVSIDGMCGVY